MRPWIFLLPLLLVAAPDGSAAMGNLRPAEVEPSPFFGLGPGKRGSVAPGENQIGTADQDVPPDLRRIGLTKPPGQENATLSAPESHGAPESPESMGARPPAGPPDASASSSSAKDAKAP